MGQMIVDQISSQFRNGVDALASAGIQQDRSTPILFGIGVGTSTIHLCSLVVQQADAPVCNDRAHLRIGGKFTFEHDEVLLEAAGFRTGVLVGKCIVTPRQSGVLFTDFDSQWVRFHEYTSDSITVLSRRYGREAVAAHLKTLAV